MVEFSRRGILLGSAALASTLALPRAARADAKLKIAYVYVGPIGDHGYTYAHDVGRRQVEKAFGAAVDVTHVENVPEGPDAERVIRQLASAGHQLIFTCSFGFMNPTLRVAQQFPQVKFEHCSGYRTASNVSIYNARFHEGRAVLGTVAALMSKTGIAGYIASFPVPEVVMGINAFTLAARRVNPNFKVRVVWVNSWFDPGKESDAAKALADQGADMLLQHTDSPAPLQVAEARGIHAFGQGSDMSDYAPHAHLTANVHNWGAYYLKRVRQTLDGKWARSDTWWGLKEGMIEIAPYNPAVPEAVRRQADAVKDGIIAGTWQPFAGPVKDQKGNLRAKDGTHLTDADLLKMDWFVDGVQS